MMRKLLLLTIAAVALMGSSARRDAYIISPGDDNRFHAGANLDELMQVRKRLSGRYIWVRRSGQEYVIREEAAIARAEELFAPNEALRPQQKAVSREERKLDREADRLSDLDRRLTPAEHQRLADLREQLRALDQRERELDEKEEALDRAAERAFWSLIESAIRSGIAKSLAALAR